MRCPACQTPDMGRTVDGPRVTARCGVCKAIGATWIDSGYIPSQPFVASPYRVPVVALEEDEEEVIEAPVVVHRAPKVPKVHPRTLPDTDPRRIAWVLALSRAAHQTAADPDTRAARSAAQLRRAEREGRRQAARAVDEATRKRAVRGAQTGKWYAEQRGAARVNRVLEMHLADERLLSWVGSSIPRMAAVVAAFGGGRVALRRAIEIAVAQKPEIPAASLGVVVDPFDEADEPVGVGAGAPWGDECRDCDGCGWTEGGAAMQTGCATCSGTGVA